MFLEGGRPGRLGRGQSLRCARHGRYTGQESAELRSSQLEFVDPYDSDVVTTSSSSLEGT